MQPKKGDIAILTAQKGKDGGKMYFEISFWRDEEDEDTKQIGKTLRIDERSDLDDFLAMFGVRQHRTIVVPNTDVTIFTLV